MRNSRTKVSLFTKFAIYYIAVALVLLAVGIAWIQHQQEEQSQHEMLETTRVLAQEMDAVWTFMEQNQPQFKLGSDGTYNLYCVVAAKAVSKIFTENSDYLIHYTNTKTRKPDDTPDSFELKALEALKSDSSLGYYYGIDEYGGERVFRYCEPVYITESCLECHGEPAGELDVKGYAKEGMKVGDIAGVASIIMPTKTFDSNLSQNVFQESMLLFFVLAGCLTVIFIGISRLVTNPLKKLQSTMNYVEKGQFDEGLDGLTRLNRFDYTDEINDLSKSFEVMTKQLKTLYGTLSEQVEDRTAKLVAANEILGEQRVRLEQTNIKLQEDNQYKTNFLSIMSHELRTPLTSVLAFEDVWSNAYGPRDENEAKIMREISLNTQVILNIVNNILETARMEAGRTTLDLEPVDLFDLVPMVKESTSALAKKRQIAMELHLDSETPVIRADGEKVRRILENLISNAIKFTPEGGTICIRTSYNQAMEMVVIGVKDNGQGIAPEDIDYIFESFIQGSTSTAYTGGGSGLGLSVVKQLVELHGGKVEVESALGIGSDFRVWIPVGDNESGELE